MIATVSYLGAQGVRHANEYIWLQRAVREPNFSPARVALLEKAFAVEPRNAATAHEIGEALRHQSLEGGEAYQHAGETNYRLLAQQAMEWFGRAMKLDRWDGYNCLGYGWCLDWLDRKEEAAPYFARAEELDPNGYFTVLSIGLHYIELGDNAAAREYF